MNTYKINDISIDVLIKQAKACDIRDTIQLLKTQLQLIQSKNRNLAIFMKINKLWVLSTKFNQYNERQFYEIFLKELKKINLSNLYEYEALIKFLEGLTRNNI